MKTENIRLNSILWSLEKNDRVISKATAGLLFATGMFELMCVNAQFIISGASQLPNDSVPLLITGILTVAGAFVAYDPKEQA